MQVLFDLVKPRKDDQIEQENNRQTNKQGLPISAVRTMNACKSDKMKLKFSYIIINL